MKLKKAYKYLIFTMSEDKKKVVFDSSGDKDASYDDFCKALPDKSCRYAVIHYIMVKENGTREKMVFVAWSPDSAPVKEKMIFAGSNTSVKKVLDGINYEFQVTDRGELKEDELKKKLEPFCKD
jgi:cofilin